MIQRRLRVIENLFQQRAQVHLAAMTQRFVARYQSDELRAIATFLDATQGATVDPALAATGAALLRRWRAEMTAGQWSDFWYLPDLAQSVNEAINDLLPPY